MNERTQGKECRLRERSTKRNNLRKRATPNAKGKKTVGGEGGV